MTGLADLLDRQAMWNYDADGNLVPPSKMPPHDAPVPDDEADFKFDPNQPRDREGKWTDGPVGVGGGASFALDDWSTMDADPSGVSRDDVFRIGTAVGEIMKRDGSDFGDSEAFGRAVFEAVETDGGGINARQYAAAMDRDFGTNTVSRITEALSAGQPSTPAPPAAAPERSIDFSAPFDERADALQASIDSGISDMDALSGGSIAETFLAEWKDGSKAVLKSASRDIGPMTPKRQTDAEELSARVANAVGVRAPATQRVDDTTLYLEYMPGRPASAVFGYGETPEHILNSDQGVRMGVLDYLINNNDRHAGNWTVDDDGNIYAIDHGLSFVSDIGSGASPFARRHFRSGPNPLTANDIATLRENLADLRPHFVRLGLAAWFDHGVMARLGDIARNAKGGRDIY